MFLQSIPPSLLPQLKTRVFALFLCILPLFLSPTKAFVLDPSRISDIDQKVSNTIETAKSDPSRLRMLLAPFPKGGDLHHHLAGAIDAETMLHWAGDAGLCVDARKLALIPAPCSLSSDKRPAKNLDRQDPALWEELVDAFSMRNYHFSPAISEHSGHDHFFASFFRFMAALDNNFGRMIAYSKQDAAANNLFYIETMQNPEAISDLTKIAYQKVSDKHDPDTLWKILNPYLTEIVSKSQAETDHAEKQAQEILQCATSTPKVGCSVTMHYMVFAIRALPPEVVFAQLALGFALAEKDPRWVGVNIVAPEDGTVAVQDYDLHMQFFSYLKKKYPHVKITLHAGELAPQLVPPAGLRNHINKAVFDAGADRVGHGIDIGWENDPTILLQAMATKPVPVEINFSSNDEILNIRGADHPFTLYRRYGVPVVISTDDPGVSRGDLTTEYMRAVREQNLSYSELKKLSRDSLEYAFLSGESLWQQGSGSAVQNVCLSTPFTTAPKGKCAEFLAKNKKAALEWQLESAFILYQEKVIKGIL
ncbi:adenosine deaminase family protein [Zymomonas mobilis]|uniref:adenosine deaminase n=1 Tax=Zymomonas mobilis subsp. pomaceae (strain ATCC 29192 / DSM 22645 / JCM 10191 / CCUG 17912 / NBRC 13757 / NCIMB 11200 / NRRL B-4491 / Barker I) TaxID=579138 RepID=F8ERL9_ZYMMT|nr:adenosine deaminase [Zymomonas mobilis]AEI37477.1 adenosine/AMP deaminase [Zymomonas mobilis subsp. pomaceae ATCC 29192]MDX5948845.1 adenosine deaminase [Zymomonas mobilis subsp. pomaceae]GEB88652.1 adenosine deaminase [Zymomonas mobilis subsp. pomaceae]